MLVNSLAAIRHNRRDTNPRRTTRAANQSWQREAAVRRSERLAALGQLSAGLAHELRNPLGSIKGSADLLARSASRNDPMAKELAEIISAEVDRTNSLVTRFLDFARPLEPRREIDRCHERYRPRRRSGRNVSVIRNYSDFPSPARHRSAS